MNRSYRSPIAYYCGMSHRLPLMRHLCEIREEIRNLRYRGIIGIHCSCSTPSCEVWSTGTVNPPSGLTTSLGVSHLFWKPLPEDWSAESLHAVNLSLAGSGKNLCVSEFFRRFHRSGTALGRSTRRFFICLNYIWLGQNEATRTIVADGCLRTFLNTRGISAIGGNTYPWTMSQFMVNAFDPLAWGSDPRQ